MPGSDTESTQRGVGHEPGRVPAAKRPYRTPKLARLGSLREMTLAVGFFGSRDGGTILFMRRTQG